MAAVDEVPIRVAPAAIIASAVSAVRIPPEAFTPSRPPTAAAIAVTASIVAPPDGAMSDYMASLRKLAARPEQTYFPGHGPAILDAVRFVNYYILHRQAREDSILHRLAKGAADIPTIVRAIYIGIDPRLTGAAGLSVLAHMEDLVARGQVETDGLPAIDGVFRLKGA